MKTARAFFAGRGSATAIAQGNALGISYLYYLQPVGLPFFLNEVNVCAIFCKTTFHYTAILFMRVSTSPLEHIEKLCLENSSSDLLQKTQLFEHQSDEFYNAISKFHEKIKSTTLTSAILLWSKQASQDRFLGERNLVLMAEFLESGLLPLAQNKVPILLADLAKQKHQTVIDTIRSHQAWLIEKQENMVTLYVEFATWLSKASCGLITIPIDLDRTVTVKRNLPFSTYLQLLFHLPIRERIFAKLYYLGGARVLDDILNLKIQDVDFKNSKIHFRDCSIYYSKHVINDLAQYIGPRKRGYVFLNRQGGRINQTVPYRALKIAAVKLGLPPSFTFRDLVKEA